MESELLVEALSLISVSFVKIDNLPLLVLSSVVSPNSNWCSFLILSTFDVKDFAGLPVDELAVFILEDLEPSGVGAPDLHVIGSSS